MTGSTPAQRSWLSPSTLRGRFALWALASTVVSVAVFALVVFIVFVIDELSEPSTLTPAQIDWETGQDVLVAMAVAMPFAVAMAAGGSYWLSKKTLAPIASVIDAARDMTARDLHQRLPVPEEESELKALVVAQNALFERLEMGFSSMSQFVANASHEIRTPLAVLANELEIALRRPRTAADWEAAARRSLDEVRRLHRLVEALVELARSDIQATTENHPVDLGQFVACVAKAFKDAASARGIAIAFGRRGEGRLRIQAVEDTLAIALSNVLTNALTYTPEGGVVKLTTERAAGEYALIHVDDSGPGVEPDESADIFTPFARGRAGKDADARNGDAPRGLGLGLAIAKRVVESQRGTVSVTRSPQGGARFTLQLPLAAERERELHEQS